MSGTLIFEFILTCFYSLAKYESYCNNVFFDKFFGKYVCFCRGL